MSDAFTDISGLFVINNESGWYEGWMIHDVVVPEVAAPRTDWHATFGTITAADAAALAAMGHHHNRTGQIFTVDGDAVSGVFRPAHAAGRNSRRQNGVCLPPTGSRPRSMS